jgi:murein DD-endopeptidase MepM/ murein hydrolase activator NlpD
MPTLSTWKDPLPAVSWSLPIGKYHPAGFGYSKSHNVHTGIDLYVPERSSVHSVEDGTVVNIFNFTGPKTLYPHLLPTKAIVVNGKTGLVLYGEVETDLSVGQLIAAGDKIAYIKCAIPDQPMLHLELYMHGSNVPCIWKQGQPQPKSLLDPTSYLLSLKTYTKR